MRAALAIRGVPFTRCYAEALEAESFSRESLLRYQARMLRSVLVSGRDKSPSFAKRCEGGQKEDSIEVTPSRLLQSFQASSRDDLVRFALEARQTGGRAFRKKSSGSTGRALTLWKDGEGMARELAATWRGHSWHGIPFGSTGIRIWGRSLSTRASVQRWLRGMLQNVTYISASDITPQSLEARLIRMRAVNPVYIYGYTSAVRDLALQVGEMTGYRLPQLKAVITTAEPLQDDVRGLIESAFSSVCVDEYGASEVGTIAHGCTGRHLHVSEDNMILEVESGAGEVSSFGTGSLLVTDLTNRMTPVIRYRLGDIVTLSQPDVCACGLPFKVITEIHGRVEDTVVTPDGRRHHPSLVCHLVGMVTQNLPGVSRYQVRQTSPSNFELLLATEKVHDRARLSRAATEIFAKHLHPHVAVSVRVVEVIEREKSGKYRIVVNEVRPL